MKGILRAHTRRVFLDWNTTDNSLSNFIIENSPFSREQIRRRFSNYCQKSIDIYLASGIECGELAYENGQYWYGDEYPGWRFPIDYQPNFQESPSV